MLNNKNLNEQCGFMLRLMNDSMYGNKDYYDYCELFKSRDKECPIWYDLAKNMDELKINYGIKYEIEWKEFNTEFDKIDKKHVLYKHFELTHSTYVEMYNKVEEHLNTINKEEMMDWQVDILSWLDYFKDTLTVRGMYNFLGTGNYNHEITRQILYEKGGIPF